MRCGFTWLFNPRLRSAPCGPWRPSAQAWEWRIQRLHGAGKWAPCFHCPSFSGRHLQNDYMPVKDSFYIIEDCPGYLSSERKKSHINYLQSSKLFPFMSADFVFVSANWDFVYPWIVFPRAWEIWLFNYEWGFLFESLLTKMCKINCFSLDPFQLPTRTEPTKEQAIQPAPTRKPTVIRIPAKPGKCKQFSASFICYSRSWGEIYANLSMSASEIMCNRPFIIITHSWEHIKASCFFIIL